MLIDKHASEVYTRTVFFDVQKEINKRLYFCLVQDLGNNRFRVTHQNKKFAAKTTYIVVHDHDAEFISYECNYFVQNGLICRHMFKVLMNHAYVTIPDYIIERRWTRSLVPVEIEAAKARYGEVDVDKERVINEVYAKVDVLVSRLRNDTEKMSSFSKTLDKMKVDFDVENYVPCPAIDKADALRDCYGVEVPEEVEIQPPSGIQNKGCGTGKRLIGAYEKASSSAKRPKRVCRLCNQLGNHDSRNCPKRAKED